MNPRTTLLLALTALIVSILAWRVVRDVRPQYVTGAERPFTFSIHSVSSVEIRRTGHDAIRIDKADFGWRIMAPIEDRGRYAPIEDLLLLLRDVRLYGQGPDELDRIGLSEAAIEVTIKTPSQVYSLALGSDHPSLARVYALVDGKSVLVSHLVRDALRDFQLAELRENAICGVALAKVKRILLERPDEQPIEIVREQANWDFLSPIAADADALAVEDWLGRIAHWAAVDYLDGEHDLPLGLDSPRAVLTIETRDGEQKTVKVGTPHPSTVRGTVAVRVSDRSPVLVAAGRVAEELVTIEATTLMSHYLLRLDDLQTVELAISAGPYGKVDLSPNPSGGWIVSWDGSSRPSVGDTEVIDDWIARLRELRVTSRFPADRSALQQWGFDIPWLRLEIVTSQGEEERLVIGSEVPDQPGARYVWNLRRDSFAISELADFELLRQAPFTLRDRRVTSLASGELVKFHIATADGMEALLVQPNDTWRCSGRVEKKLPQPDIRLMARRLSTLVASHWLAEEISAPQADQFVLKASLFALADQQPFVTIYFGERGSDGLRRARIGEDGWVFSVAPSDGPDLVTFCQLFLTELEQQGAGGGGNR